MSEAAFKSGDRVRLSVGGPAMAVDFVRSDGMVVCVWFNGGELRGGAFRSATLVHVQTESEWKARHRAAKKEPMRDR